MPGEMELNKERRKQLAELTLEYPTGTSKKENMTQKFMGRQRYYACQKCKGAFTTIMGKTRHLEHNPECIEVPQMENWKTDADAVTETSETRPS